MGHSPLRSPTFQNVVMTLLVFFGVMGLRWEGFLMRHLNAQWQQQGLPVVRMLMGIQTGPVVV